MRVKERMRVCTASILTGCVYFIGINFRGYKLTRSREILTEFSDFHVDFDHFSVLFINISRLTSKYAFAGINFRER